MKRGARSLIALAGLLWALQAGAAHLSAQVDHTESPLGAPINLTFTAQGLPLEQLDLRPLTRDFELGPSTSSQSNDQRTLSLKLYPLHTGKIMLPAFKLGAAHTQPLALRITSGSDLVPTVYTSLRMEPTDPMVQQPARLVLDICDDGSLLWQRPMLPTGDGLYQQPMGETQTQTTRNRAACTLHRYVWAVMATRAGSLSIRLPMLAASKFGTALRFPPPGLQFTARAPPPWLPLAVPIGPLQVSADPLPARWPLHRPLPWTITVRGGLGADELRRLLTLQLAAHPQLAAYPPAVETLAQSGDSATGFTLRAQIYLRPDRSGRLHIPRLVFPWFDPAQRELQAAVMPAREVRIFNPLYARLVHGAAILAAALALSVAGLRLLRYARLMLAHRRCLDAVRNAQDITSLNRALRLCFASADKKPAPTLGEWWQRLPAKKQTADLAKQVRALEVMSYGVNQAKADTLKTELLKCLRRL